MKAELVSFLSPKNIQLFGVYKSKNQSKSAFLFIHGLGSSVFKKLDLISNLESKDYSVLAFNNRGSGIINSYNKIAKYQKKSKIYGTAHEIFSDCRDDISGAINYLKKEKKIKNIILVGHSTGCQKSVYYLANRNYDRSVKALVLLAPISDFSSIYKLMDKKIIDKAQALALNLVKNKKENTLLDLNIWPYYLDAQRFLSLYTKNSLENIFHYNQDSKKSSLLKKVKVPIFSLIGTEDRFLDDKPENINKWILDNSFNKKTNTEIILGAGHSFSTYEKIISDKIKVWLKRI